MIAAVLEKLKKPLVIHKLEVPNLDFGQVLVELKYSGICGRQLQEINGDKGKDNFLPHLMGHEGVALKESWFRSFRAMLEISFTLERVTNSTKFQNIKV